MIPRSWQLPSLCLLTALAFSGCATFVHDNHQSVRIYTDPGEAKVTIDGQIQFLSVGTANLSRLSDHTAVIEKDGYEPVTIRIERSMSNWVWWNFWCLPFFQYWCVQKDKHDGGYYTFDEEIFVTLTRRVEAPPVAPAAP